RRPFFRPLVSPPSSEGKPSRLASSSMNSHQRRCARPGMERTDATPTSAQEDTSGRAAGWRRHTPMRWDEGRRKVEGAAMAGKPMFMRVSKMQARCCDDKARCSDERPRSYDELAAML